MAFFNVQLWGLTWLCCILELTISTVIQMLTIIQCRKASFEGIGPKIRELRLSKDLTTIEFCKLAGLTRAYLTRIEAETLTGGISVELLRRIEQVLETDFGVYQFDTPVELFKRFR